MRMRVQMEKGDMYRLEDMETQFVSLVRAGANRQTKFMVVKREDAQTPPDVDVTPDGASPEDASNQDREAASAKDAEFLAMLGVAFAHVDGLLIDTQLDAAIDKSRSAPAEAPATGKTIKREKTGDRSSAHSDDNSSELQKQLTAEREEHAKAQDELRKTRADLRKNESTVKRLRSTIGKSTALSYGEIDVVDATAAKPIGALWGGDLADEATMNE